MYPILNEEILNEILNEVFLSLKRSRSDAQMSLMKTVVFKSSMSLRALARHHVYDP